MAHPTTHSPTHGRPQRVQKEGFRKITLTWVDILLSCPHVRRTRLTERKFKTNALLEKVILAGKYTHTVTTCTAVLLLFCCFFLSSSSPPFLLSSLPLALHAEVGQKIWRSFSDFCLHQYVPPSASWQLSACCTCSQGQGGAWQSVFLFASVLPF